MVMTAAATPAVEEFLIDVTDVLLKRKVVIIAMRYYDE
jgi:hypothetical protein